MRIVLPGNVECTVHFQPEVKTCPMNLVFNQGSKHLGEFALNYDTYPELRYLLILYFYNEYIPVDGKSPHAITLEEYVEIYEAMFGIKCVYTDKNTSIDHLRSYELNNRILKDCGLRFVHGGLCEFKQGIPDETARELFRSELLACFHSASTAPGISQRAKDLLLQRYSILCGYTSVSPSRYLGLPRLLEQTLELDEKNWLLYSQESPINWDEELEKHSHLFLIGVSGSGKSTLLNYIAHNPNVNRFYHVVKKHLATQSHLYTKGDLDKLGKYPGIKHLYLLDGFNELPHEGNVRANILNELRRLTGYRNVRIMLSSTSTRGLWPGFTVAKLGSMAVSQGGRGNGSIITETPLMYNAFMSVPREERTKLTNEYLVLEYAMKVKLSAVMTKASAKDALLIHIAYEALLPMIAERLCLKDEQSFDLYDVHELCERMRHFGTEENAMLRHCFESAAEDLPNISLWSVEQLENAFSRLIETGEVFLADKHYQLRHQRIRDFCAVEYELRKLRVLLSESSDRFIMPRMKLSPSAQDLLRQALGVPVSPKLPKHGSLLDDLIRAIPKIEESEQFTSTAIKLVCVYAEIYEYTQQLSARNALTNKNAEQILWRVVGWVCEYPEISNALINEMGENGIEDSLAFALCRQAELTLDYFYSETHQRQRVIDCVGIVDKGMLSLHSCPRLMHAKAKALMHASELEFCDGKIENAKRLLTESMSLLASCFADGSFLSGNLLAFMQRTPVPYLLHLKPDMRDYKNSFIINISIATDPKLNGVSPTYARNEAIDALLMGEVKVNFFPGLGAFSQMLRAPDGLAKAVMTGNGVCGKRELKLVQALLESKGGTLGDTRPMTAFYEFMADWYEWAFTNFAPKVLESLVDKHIPRLKNRLNAATIDKPLDLLVLVVYGDGFIDNMNYRSELGQLIRTISKGLLDLATAPYDHTEGDVDHIYYTCKKILYYSRLFSRNNNVTSLRDISLALDQLKESIHAFETKYPLMKE